MAETDIAIVGMAAHLPGARSTTELWTALTEGHESIRQLSEEELLEAGVSREAMRRPGYVRAAAVLDDVFHFDAEFFGFSPKEAAIMDPQHRHFLMAAWEALEDAGHPPSRFDGAIGVFAGCGQNSYFVQNLLSNPDLVHEVGPFLLRHTGNDKDFLSTRASYVFNLRGPSINVQTACSTSLVATHLAVQHLLSGECDLALAGGVTIELPHGQGYEYQEGEILSPDGHCRAFDHRSKGTVFGSGTGVVVLRRLEDALDDGDHVYAVIKGTAVNNDGAQKVGYLAPSVDGQAACIAEALAVADVEPSTIGYVECHGTGTPMGDPIEIAALTEAFGADGGPASCRIGSIKTNIGHLDTAAGVAGLIKVALSLQNGAVPASLNFESPNPALELERGPFVVNDELLEWHPTGSAPRRGAVNSLGVGGTNAFAVLEEAPEQGPSPRTDRLRLLTLTGRTRAALEANAARLADHLEAHPDLDLADVAWTLQVGRHHFAERRVLAVRDVDDAIEVLRSGNPQRSFTHTAGSSERSIVFMFPGGGVQHVGMAADLYASEPLFARHLDEGLRLLEEQHDLHLRDLLFAPPHARDDAERQLEEMVVQLPLVFIIEHALAQLLLSWGLSPRAMVGYSVGENTAACVAGTISFEDCLGLVVLRGRLMGRAPGGALAVALGHEELAPTLERHGVDLAIVNGPELCVVSGAHDRLAAVDADLRELGVEPIRVPMTTAAHSRELDPVLDEFRAYLESIELRAPSIPWVSNRTGTWITDDEATDPGYWVDHLRHTVRFSDCIATLAEDPALTLLEVGPRRSLSSVVRAHPDLSTGQVAIPLMRHPNEDVRDDVHLLTALGRIWAVGGALDTDRLFDDGPRRRVSLPTYAFQTQPFKIEPGHGRAEASSGAFVDREDDLDRWFWKDVWRSKDVDEPTDGPLSWLVVIDQSSTAAAVVDRLRARGDQVVVTRCGDSFLAVSDEEYVIAPELGLPTYESLVQELVRTGRLPDRIAHLGLLATDDTRFRPGSSFFHRNQELGFQSLVSLAQAWAGAGIQKPLHITVATMGAQRALPSDRPRWPEQSTVLGPVLVIPRELPDVTASTVDIDPRDLRRADRPSARVERARLALADRIAGGGPPGGVAPTGEDRLVDALVDELLAPPGDVRVALRGERRLVHDVRRSATPSERPHRRLRDHAAVLITGGLGGIGLTVAESLVERHDARLALVSRTTLPERAEWDELLQRLGPDHPIARRIRQVRSLEARGATVLLLEGDVTDVTDVARITGAVRERFGSLDAVIHAAGTVADELIVAKPQADMEDVLAPKVYGTLVLEEATKDDDLDAFVVFSSTSTITAPVGQVDYVAANAFLNAWAASRRAAGARHVLALDWGVWQEVGMAAAMQEQSPTAEPAERRPTAHPFFDELAIAADGVARLTSRWSASTEWFLDDHRTGSGDALLPGTGYLELARAALLELGLDRPFEIRGLTFLRPLGVPDDETVTVETVLEPTPEGYLMSVREQVDVSPAVTEGGPVEGRSGWRRTAEATLLLYQQDPAPSVDLDAMAETCPRRMATRTAQQDHLRFGPRWDVVQRAQRGPDDAMAWLSLPEEYRGGLDAVTLHPGMLDLATGFAMDLIDGYTGDELWVPIDYQRVTVFAGLTPEVVSLARARSTSGEENGFATFDVTICDPSGRVLVLVSGFTIRRLDGPLTSSRERVLATELEPEATRARPLSRSELVFQHNLSQGIRPTEGAEAFVRALATDLDVVYVSSMDLHHLRRQSSDVASEQAGGSDSSAVFGRPELDAEYVEPRDDVERTLVDMWQELLGIDQIGVFDGFFDLGGHSLIAVRLFARIKRTFGVEFPISVLFEAPTIAASADLVRAALPEEADAADGADDEDPSAKGTITATKPRFRHLVAMHPGEGGPRTPFFLVAGMFGNVLNLRHLAHLIGTDRPFYGVQARGIYGEDEPHDDFLEMAEEYVTELLQVQPRGPYLLGGFSGGGITALEIARILRAKGEDVGLLVMLDTPVPLDRELTTAEKLALHSAQLRREGPAYVARWARARIAWERELRHRERNGAEVPQEDGALHSQTVMEAFYRAIDRYEMRHYDGRITLYRPRLNPLHVFAPDRQINIHRRFIHHDNGWGPWCDEVDVTEVPGDHDSMVLEPNVRVLAAKIRAEIAAADERAPVQPGLAPSGGR